MPATITMPQLSDTMSEGTLIKWYKKPGDKISAGDKIADIETDKAVMEQEAFDEHEGTLAKILVNEGQKAKVGETLAVVATKGEKTEDVAKVSGAPASKSEPSSRVPAQREIPGQSDAQKSAPTSPRPREPQDARQKRDTTAASLPEGSPLESGRAQARQELTRSSTQRSSEELAQQAQRATSHERDGGTAVAEPRPERARVSPLARRLAGEMRIDLSAVRGSGPGGRIIQRDILNFKAPAAQPDRRPEERSTVQPPTFAARAATGAKEVLPLSKIRTVIAQRLQQSKQTIPHFYESIDADITELAAMRERVNKQLEKSGVRLSVADFIAKAVTNALLQHRHLNAHFSGEKNEITEFGDVHLGMAVALEDGLIVPVLRNINQMGLAEIRTKSADLVDRARAQRLKQEELSGATFTVSNLGTHGIREFAAIINPPEVGILAIGVAENRPVVRGEAIVPRLMITLTLSADHRAVDGAIAADFLRTLKAMLEEPGMMLI